MAGRVLLGQAGRDGRAALARLVGDVDVFLRDFFMQRWMLRRSDDVAADLLTRAGVDRLLAKRRLRAGRGDIRLVRIDAEGGLDAASWTTTAVVGGREHDDVADPGRVQEHFDDGATVVLQGLERHVPEVARLCRQLDLLLAHGTQVNAYLTPKAAQGLNVHHDTHDVLVVLLDGEKRFECFTPIVRDAAPGTDWRTDDRPAEGSCELDAVLTPGDVLYLPRGTPHRAWTGSAESLHLTIGLTGSTRHTALEGLVRRLVDVEDFRRGFPPAYLADPGVASSCGQELVEVLVDWLHQHGADAIAELAVEDFVTSRRPGYASVGTFACNLASYAVDDALVVKLRDGLCALVADGPAGPTLRWFDRARPLTPGQAAALGCIADHPDGTAVGALCAWLDQDARWELIRDLLRDGILEPVP